MTSVVFKPMKITRKPQEYSVCNQYQTKNYGESLIFKIRAIHTAYSAVKKFDVSIILWIQT